MKTQKLPFTLLMLFISFSIQGQNIDPASEWRVNYSLWEPQVFVDHYFYKYFINGDTIIDSKDYLKIFKSGYFYRDMNYGGIDYYYFENVFSGYILVENEKWYVFEDNQEMILYDFSLNVNDTVYSAYSSNPENPIIVTAIDSVPVNNTYKKRFHLNIENGAEYIIEDIGATSGLFENMFFFQIILEQSALICFAENGISIWGESTEECDLAVLINESPVLNNSCSIFPNPAQDFTLLTIPEGFGDVACTLVDSFGGIVYQGNFESPSFNNIQLTSYHSGIYIAVIESNGLRQTIKLIIE